MEQAQKAQLFKNMHHADAGLLLPNAWNAASARIFEKAGFPAIGTTSAGIAYSRGYADGEQISRAEMMREIERIVSVVQVPVTADIEAGYGTEPEAVQQTVAEVIAIGSVGINLEDSTGDPTQPLFTIDAQTARLRAARAEANRSGVALVINARIDTYFPHATDTQTRFQETVQRANAYFAAGADCVFVLFVADSATIAQLAHAIPGPLNVLASPGAPPIPELFLLGAARVSIGPLAALASLGVVRDIAHELLERGTYEALARSPYGFTNADALFAKRT